MGILRADRITGLGGANAIKGSTKLSSNRLLEVHGAESNEDFRLSNGSFTIEFWAYVADTSNSTFVGLFENNPARRSWQFEARSNQALRFEWWTDGSSGSNLTASTGSFIRDRWHHFAVVRNGTALNIYVDGTSVANTTTSDTFYENTIEPLSIGGIFQSGALTQDITGFISNLRIIKGEAIYTANFTPPTSELTVTSNTVVLACQSPGNILQEATGKTIVARTTSTNDAPPEASHFTPNSPVGFSTTTDVGTQFGSTFDGVTTFDSQSYMVVPGGNTRERNRGRAVVGWANNPVNTGMDVFNIQSSGNATAFGNLTSGNRWGSHAFSSATRGLWTGGYINSGPAFFNTIEFVTIATNGNPTDFADTTSQNYRSGCCSSSTKGIIALGYIAPNFSIVNTIDQVTMATAGNATNFGDLFQTRANMASASSPTRGFFAGGVTPANQGTIDFITIASEADAQDFGDLQAAVDSPMALASTTRGIIAGGYPGPPGNINVINFITIASEGNAQDFGDLRNSKSVGSAVSNKTRGVFTGGYSTPLKLNVMDFVTIASVGNAQDFGDLVYGRRDFGSCCDSHGGLSE